MFDHLPCTLPLLSACVGTVLMSNVAAVTPLTACAGHGADQGRS